MKVERIDIMIVEIPMRFAVQHALAERRRAKSVLVGVTDAEGRRGWGESCPRPYVTGETTGSVKETISKRLAPALIGESFDAFSEVVAGLEELLQKRPRNELAAFCALELALLDLAGKRFGVSAGEVLGPVRRDKVRYSGVIAANDPGQVAALAARMKKYALSEVKIKLGKDLEHNIALLLAARRELGEKISLRADANAAWTGEEALRQLEALSPFKLEGIEQPVAADDLAGLQYVAAAGLMPVVADESLCSLEDALRLIESNACHIFNIRISKCGGLINARRIYQAAVDAGFRCQLGAQVGEAGFLSAAGRHFATRCEELVWLEGSYGRFLLEDDIAQPDVAIEPGGIGHAIEGAGLGVDPIPAKIEKYLSERLSVG